MAVLGLSDIIPRIYEGIFDDTALRDVLSALAPRLRADNMTFAVFDRNAGRLSRDVSTTALPPEWREDYVQLYARLSPFSPALYTSVKHQDVLSDTSTSGQVRHVLALAVSFSAQSHALVSAHRQRDGGEFLDADKQVLDAVVPHLSVLSTVRSRLSMAGAQTRGLMQDCNAKNVGVLILDNALRVLDVNTVAEAALRQECAGLHLRGLRLACRDEDDDHRMMRLLAAAAHLLGDGGQQTTDALHALKIGGKPGADGMILSVAPVRRLPVSAGGGYAAFCLLLHRSDATSEKPLAPARDLTPAERRLAQLLIGGCSSKEAAFQLDISLNTLAIHRHRIYRKLGVSSQRELMMAVLDGQSGDTDGAGGSLGRAG